MDKAVKTINRYEHEFDESKKKLMKLHEYLDNERFNAREYEKNLDNLGKYRIAWTTNQMQDKIKPMEQYFEDPTRMPEFDEKLQ